MEKQIRQIFTKKSTITIINGMQQKKWEGAEKEAALDVLKSRGEDISMYLDDEESGLQTLSETSGKDPIVENTIKKFGEDFYEKVNLAVEKIIASEDSEFIKKLENIFNKEVPELEDFTEEQANKILKLAEGIKVNKTKKPKVEKSKQTEEVKEVLPSIEVKNVENTKTKKVRKVEELTAEQKYILEEQLKKLESGEVRKKEVIITCMEVGITKQQMDRNIDNKVIHWTTIYNLYKELGK